MSDTPTILIVDDDQIILESVTDIMRLAGYKTAKATNGREALEMIEASPPNLIVADVMMPEMTGIELFQAVRQRSEWESIPFIFLTARGTKEDIRQGLSMGADYYLTKPFEPEDLLVAAQSRLQRTDRLQSVSQQEIEKTKQQLINVFSHEFRTPLSTLYGSIALLREGRDLMDVDSMSHTLDMMSASADRLVRLVDDLMLVTTIQSGIMAGEIARYSQPTDLSHELTQATRELSIAASQRNVRLTSRVPQNLTVIGIPTYLNDVFRRLIDNAIKFSKRSGGNVWIDAQIDDEKGMAAITIKDEGVGIDSEQLGRLFQPLQQINRERQEQQGVGIGLALAKGIVDLHNGAITVDSKPDEGSAFTVTLPLHRVGR